MHRQGRKLELILSFFFLCGGIALASAQSSVSSSERDLILQTERAALQKRQFGEAIRLVQDGLRRFPGDIELSVDLGRAYLYNRQDDRAIDLFHEVLRKHPTNRVAKLELARALGYRHAYADSDQLYRELLQANPDDEAASVGLIRNLIREKRRDEARSQLILALARYPENKKLQEYKRVLDRKSGMASEGGGESKVNRVALDHEYFMDSNQNRFWRLTQRADTRIFSRLTNHLQTQEQSLWIASGPKANVLSATDELQFQLTPFLSVSGQAGTVRFADSSTRALYRGQIQLNPRRGLLFSAGFARNHVTPTYQSTLFNLLGEGWFARMNWETDAWQANASWTRQHYSDGNSMHRERAELVRWIGNRQFAIAAGYKVKYSDFLLDLSHGYFDPDRYMSHLGVTGVRFRVGRNFRGEYLVRVGEETIWSTSMLNHVAWEASVRNYATWGNWVLGLDYSYFGLAQASGASHAHVPRAQITYRF